MKLSITISFLILTQPSLPIFAKNTLTSFLLPPTTIKRKYSHYTVTTTKGSAEALGELSAPDPPDLNQSLVLAANTKLWWEKETETEKQEEDLPADNNNSNNENQWQNGQVWNKTRQTLIKLWILPRDMSNGAATHYANAASKAEIKILSEVPQLLRLDSDEVISSAKTILGTGLTGGNGGLPPALVRSEPVLLTFPSDCIRGGIDLLCHSTEDSDGDTDSVENDHAKRKDVLSACRDTPGLLRESIEAFIQLNQKKQRE